MEGGNRTFGYLPATPDMYVRVYLREPEKKSRKDACILVSDVQGAAPTTKGMIQGQGS